MLMARRAPRGAVHDFEPVALIWHLLCAGATLNGFQHVVANCSAIGSEEGTASFSRSADGLYSSLIPVGRKPEAARTTVRVETLAGYLGRSGLARVDVLKVDVEGAEGLVLDG